MNIVKEYNLADEILESNNRRKAKGVRPVDLENLFDNQPHELAQHLKHENNHRMLDRYKAAPRSPVPGWIERRRRQILYGGNS